MVVITVSDIMGASRQLEAAESDTIDALCARHDLIDVTYVCQGMDTPGSTPINELSVPHITLVPRLQSGRRTTRSSAMSQLIITRGNHEYHVFIKGLPEDMVKLQQMDPEEFKNLVDACLPPSSTSTSTSTSTPTSTPTKSKQQYKAPTIAKRRQRTAERRQQQATMAAVKAAVMASRKQREESMHRALNKMSKDLKE
jgi:hypothetical protein